jgi:Flp pilus assembly pilin Flp
MLTTTKGVLERFHEDEGGVVTTEYMIVFVFLALTAAVAAFATAAYIKGYRDFLVWWFSNPAV